MPAGSCTGCLVREMESRGKEREGRKEEDLYQYSKVTVADFFNMDHREGVCVWWWGWGATAPAHQ